MAPTDGRGLRPGCFAPLSMTPGVRADRSGGPLTPLVPFPQPPYNPEKLWSPMSDEAKMRAVGRPWVGPRGFRNEFIRDHGWFGGGRIGERIRERHES